MKKKEKKRIVVGAILLLLILNYFGMIPFGVGGITVEKIYSTGTRLQYVSVMADGIRGDEIGYVKQGTRICSRGHIFILDEDQGWIKLSSLVGRDQYCCMYSQVTDQFTPSDDKICYYNGDQHNWDYTSLGGVPGDCPILYSGQTITRLNGDVWQCGEISPLETDITMKYYDLTVWVQVVGDGTTTTTSTTINGPTTTTTIGECADDETLIVGNCVKTEHLIIIGLLSVFVIGGWYYYKKK